MIIGSEQTQYYSYYFKYDFILEVFEFCQLIKAKVGWKEFNYSDGLWRFKDLAIISIIQSKYPDVQIDDSIQYEWNQYLITKIEDKMVEDRANQLKAKTTSDLVIKGLKGKLYDFQKVSVEFLINNNGKAIINSDMGCFSADTEYLSPVGWKRIDEYNNDLVCQYNIEKQEASFVKPIKYIKLSCNEMYYFKHTRGLDQLISGEHRVLWFDEKNKHHVSSAQDLHEDHRSKKGGCKARFLSAFNLETNSKIKLNEMELRLQIACMADGYFFQKEKHKVRIRIKKQEKIKRLEWLLKQNNIQYKFYKDIDGCNSYTFKPILFTKHFNKQFWLASYKQRQIICDEVKYWDASIRHKNDSAGIEYFCQYKKDADFIQYCFVSTNKRARLIVERDRGYHTRCHIVRAIGSGRSTNFVNIGTNKQNIQKIKYKDGFKYCFEVPSTFLIMRRNGCVFISGNTGKSLVALAYVVHEKIEKTLIITPASVKWSFENEVSKWTNLKPIVIDGGTKFTIDVFNENQVFIINYDLLKKFFTQLINFRFEIIIIDEAQKIKSIQAIRSKLIKQIAKRIPKVILLTGSLMLNRPCELFNPLNILDPFVWNNWRYFTKKYCDGHNDYWGYNFSGASNIDELKEKISKYYIRHLKEDVLKDLPEKIFINIPVELDSKSRFEYDLALNSFIVYLRSIKRKNNVEIRKSLQAEKLTSLNYLRQIATNGKLSSIEDLIEDIIESDQKVIVFSCYNEPLKKLKEKFGNSAVLLIGETPELVRKESINTFQNKSEVKVFLCGFSSGGVGITLTAASNIIFCDFPWCPSDLSQAYSRAHRIGNKADHINIYQMIARGTIDTKIRAILDNKQMLIDRIFNIKEVEIIKQTSIIEDILNEIQKEI
jgi:SWI/SNF-related matrix-associated actin-dependent regulator 1 of chromatin subfamily A